jgi:uncharacterized membrane protein YeaQ/YmgE (transglycosylase-associated protein family)
MDIVWFLIIGLIAGWLAGQLMRGRGFGLIGNLIIGVLGAIIGGYLFGQFDPDAFDLEEVSWAQLSAVIFLDSWVWALPALSAR